MTFRLFVDSSTGVDVEPEYNYKEESQKIESRHRTRDGSQYVYKWGDYTRIKFGVTYVDSSFRCQVNSWWGANQPLLWMEEGGTDVTSVYLANKRTPVSGIMRPYDDLFKGMLELETY